MMSTALCTESSLPPPPLPTSSNINNNNHSVINKNNKSEEEDHKDIINNLLISQLPKTRGFLVGPNSTLTFYQNFWIPSAIVRNVLAFQAHFKAQDQDIIVASYPKSGATWLKALTFSIVNRSRYTLTDIPLLSKNPHELVPFVEFFTYAGASCPEVGPISDTRLLATHVPYLSLPESVRSSDSKSRIVYICRNSLDVVVSSWHFATTNSGWTIEDYVNDKFCTGETGFGPYWTHVLGFWEASLESPTKVLFLRYEEMNKDATTQVKRIAEFVGHPFSQEEESRGAVDEIVRLCSLENLKDLEVNKTGKFSPNFENKSFFRKGKVGDWVNHLNKSLVDSINNVVDQNLKGSGLTFQ